MHLNHVVQLSLGTTTEALDLGLPAIVVGLGDSGESGSVPLKVSSLLADGSCNCGDTGCDGPIPDRYDVSCSSTDFVHAGGSSSSSVNVGTITDCCSLVGGLGGGVSVGLSTTPTDSLNLLPFGQEKKESVSEGEDKKHTEYHHTHESPVRSRMVESVECPVRSDEVESKARVSEKERSESERVRVRATSKPKKLRTRQVPESKGCVPPPQSLLAARTRSIREVKSRRHKELLIPRAVPLAQGEEKAHAFFVPLMDLCHVDTPLVKRVPNSQCSRFATMWGKLLTQAVTDKSLGSWSEFFMFPKCILWTPVRGGKRIAKKTNFTDLVRVRLNKWSAAGREDLWKDVLERSKRPLVESPPKPKSDGTLLEAAVISALRLGDVRKALQMLNSAPIAPKTAATCLSEEASSARFTTVSHPSCTCTSLLCRHCSQVPQFLWARFGSGIVRLQALAFAAVHACRVLLLQ